MIEKGIVFCFQKYNFIQYVSHFENHGNSVKLTVNMHSNDKNYFQNIDILIFR